jgi:hypothetical protein
VVIKKKVVLKILEGKKKEKGKRKGEGENWVLEN